MTLGWCVALMFDAETNGKDQVGKRRVAPADDGAAIRDPIQPPNDHE
ncbi:hypothetical protein ACW7AA_15940 [Azospirillum argentinense]